MIGHLMTLEGGMGSGATVFRAAYEDELSRALSLSAGLPPWPGERPSQCFVAVRDQPVERLVGAAFWRAISGAQEGGPAQAAEFEWGMTAACEGTPLELTFLRALAGEVTRREAQATGLITASRVSEPERAAIALRKAGFKPVAVQTIYAGEIAALKSWLADVSSSLPDGLEIRAPAPEHFKELCPLLCDIPGGLRATELAHGLRTAGGEEPSLFDARCSAILLKAGKITAVCLADAQNDLCKIAALHLLPAWENILEGLLLHVLQGAEKFASPSRLTFSGGGDPQDSVAARLAGMSGMKAVGEVALFRLDLLVEGGVHDEQIYPGGMPSRP